MKTRDQRPETRDQGPGTEDQESPEVLALARELFDVGMRELFAKKLCTRVYTWEERIGTNSLVCLAIARHVVKTRVQWHYIKSTALPVDHLLLVAVEENLGVYEAFFCAERRVWKAANSGRQIEYTVYAWAHLPAAPAKQGGAS